MGIYINFEKPFRLDKRMNFTLKYTFIIALLIHLFLIVNGLQNVDSMWGTYYSKFDSSDVGRFTLSYLSGLSSYFDLQYFNSLLSIIYLSITTMLLVELFDIKNKWLIGLFIILYTAFPSVSGTLTYSFLTDAYFLSTLLVVISIYIIKMRSNWLTVSVAPILIYISLGTYQANLAYLITLLIILFIKDVIHHSILKKFYIQSAFITILGLLFYVIHYKVYERTNSLSTYQGVNEAGNISLATILEAFKKAIDSFNMYFFGSFEFTNLFEILNLLIVILLVLGIILIALIKKLNLVQCIFILLSLIALPFTIFIMYFISSNLFYHNLMIHQMTFIYGLVIVIIELLLLENKMYINTIISRIGFVVLFLISFNLVIITNIYYEKLDTINKQTFSILNHVAYDIKNIEGYTDEMEVMLVGDPSLILTPIPLYDQKTPPMSAGTSQYLVNSSNKFSNYLRFFIGLHNPPAFDEAEILSRNKDEIDNLPQWPSKEYIKVIEGVIVIKFPLQ